MTKPYSYNSPCMFGPCETTRRDTDFFCRPCYRALPQHLKNGLWNRNAHELADAINKAREWLQHRWDNMLIVKEEGP